MTSKSSVLLHLVIAECQRKHSHSRIFYLNHARAMFLEQLERQYMPYVTEWGGWGAEGCEDHQGACSATGGTRVWGRQIKKCYT